VPKWSAPGIVKEAAFEKKKRIRLHRRKKEKVFITTPLRKRSNGRDSGEDSRARKKKKPTKGAFMPIERPERQGRKSHG